MAVVVKVQLKGSLIRLAKAVSLTSRTNCTCYSNRLSDRVFQDMDEIRVDGGGGEQATGNGRPTDRSVRYPLRRTRFQ